MPFVSEYHKYVTICTIANPVVGDYILQVRTNVAVPAMTPVTTATANSATQATIQTDLARPTERGHGLRPQPLRHRGVLRHPDQPGRGVGGSRRQAAHVREPG